MELLRFLRLVKRDANIFRFEIADGERAVRRLSGDHKVGGATGHTLWLIGGADAWKDGLKQVAQVGAVGMLGGVPLLAQTLDATKIGAEGGVCGFAGGHVWRTPCWTSRIGGR